MGAILLVGAGEETSWGQRIFDFETPAVLRGANVQEEANLHNLGNYWANYVLMIGFM